MTTDEPTRRTEPRAPDAPATRLFAVRLWREELGGGSEYRGSVRDVATDAFLGFRDWLDLVAFMVARMERRDGRPAGRRGEG